MKLFYLSSKDARGTASDFVAPLVRTLSVMEGGKFRIDQLRLGVAFMLVNPNNRYVFYREGPHYGFATLELGQYDSQTLATTLGFVLTNSSPRLFGGVTVKYSIVSASTVLTYTPPASNPDWTFEILSDQQLSQLSLDTLKQAIIEEVNRAVLDYANDVVAGGGSRIAMAKLAFQAVQTMDLNAPQSFNNVLGIHTSVQDGSKTVITFRFISTQPYDCLFLCSQKLGGTSIQGPRGNCDTLMQIIVNVPFGGVQEASMPYGVWISSGGIVAHELDFQIKDAKGHIVDMSLGGDVSFLLTIDDGN